MLGCVFWLRLCLILRGGLLPNLKRTPFCLEWLSSVPVGPSSLCHPLLELQPCLVFIRVLGVPAHSDAQAPSTLCPQNCFPSPDPPLNEGRNYEPWFSCFAVEHRSSLLGGVGVCHDEMLIR